MTTDKGQLALVQPEPTAGSGDKLRLGQSYQMASVRRWQRPSFAGMTPEKLSSILKQVSRGLCEDWAHFCSHMTRTDAHLKAVRDTRILGVAGAKVVVEAGYAPPGQESIAEDAADFFRMAIDGTPGFEDIVAGLVSAEDVGWAGARHQWYRENGAWLTAPGMIHHADIAFADDWTPIVRTWGDPNEIDPSLKTSHTGSGTWLNTSRFKPGTWIMHVPGGVGESPNLAGDLHSIAWIWVFKHWAELWRQTSLERFANPLIYGIYGANATATARDALFDGLTSLSGDHIGTFEVPPDGGDPIRTVDVSTSAGAAHTEAINAMNKDMSKALLGSDINVEIGNTGGNRAVAQSQRETTIIPRLAAFSRRLGTTIEQQWARPQMRINAHLFGGRVPPTPRIRWVFVEEDKPQIQQFHIDGGVVRRDELRESAGLEPEGGDWGGQFVVPIAKTAPTFNRVPEVTSDPAPFSRRPTTGRAEQMKLPLTTRRSAKTSPTRSASATQIELVPFESSDDHAK